MGAALTRPSGIASASARAPACGVLTILVPIGAGFGHGTRTHTGLKVRRSPSIGRGEQIT
jgi:hypothetical protein